MENTSLKDGFLGQKMMSLTKSLIQFSMNNKLSKKFYITDLGYFPKANYHYRKRNKGSNQYIFIYCVNGKGEVMIENERTKISPNQFFIFPKKVKHEYKSDELDPWSIYWFHFDGEMAIDLFERYQSSNSSNYKTIPFTKEKLKTFEKIFSLFNHSSLKNEIEYANLLSLNFISSFIYNDFEFEINQNDHNNIVNSIKLYLIENLDKNLTLEDIASKFNYSKSYLHTKFKNNTGYPIIVFFNLIKTQKACEYLNYTDLSIKEISFKLGFDDPFYFSRIFKNFMGKSPKNYKKGFDI